MIREQNSGSVLGRAASQLMSVAERICELSYISEEYKTQEDKENIALYEDMINQEVFNAQRLTLLVTKCISKLNEANSSENLDEGESAFMPGELNGKIKGTPASKEGE